MRARLVGCSTADAEAGRPHLADLEFPSVQDVLPHAANTALVTTTCSAVIWPSLSYRDAPAAVRFLVDAFGFTTTIVVAGQEVGEQDRTIAHAELRSPLGGCIMRQSATDGEGSDLQPAPGSSYTYVVTDEPDLLFTRATQAGAELLHGLYDARQYVSRGFAVRDPEGNVWDFGTYRGATDAAGRPAR
jgi:uncharacterized glyoxalase superfamily protein PhnB